jgi:hypothetical protein
MAELGQLRRFSDVCDMSALPPTTAVMMQCRERQKGAISGCEQLQQGSPYSITSSASAKSFGENWIPSALAVFRLITNSNLVGCWTGSSPG